MSLLRSNVDINVVVRYAKGEGIAYRIRRGWARQSASLPTLKM